MRQSSRSLVFLLACSLLLPSPRVSAGILEQDLIDRVEFLHFAGLYLAVTISDYVRSFILGEEDKKLQRTADDLSQFGEIDKLWREQLISFHLEQIKHFHLILFPADDSPSLKASQENLHAIGQIAPGTQSAIDKSYEREVHLPVSGQMLSLLVKFVKVEEDPQAFIDSLSNDERIDLIKEARYLKADKIASFLGGTPRSHTPKTNDNSHIVHTQPVDTPPNSIRDRKQSRSSRFLTAVFKKEKSEKRKASVPEKKEPLPVESAPIHVTEILIPKNVTPFEQLLHFASALTDNNNLLCHYYPVVITDDELAGLLKLNSGDRLYDNFVQALIKCFAEEGFPNGIPLRFLLDRLEPFLSDTTMGKSFREKLELATNDNSLSHISTPFEGLASIFKDFSDDAVIAAAWTQSHINLFHNVKPADLAYREGKTAEDNSFLLISHATDDAQSQLLKLIEVQTSDEAKLTLLERLVTISDYMLKAGDYHGAFIIHLTFLASKTAYPLLQDGAKEKALMASKLMQVFAVSQDFKFCKDKLNDLRSSGVLNFLRPGFFYVQGFDRIQSTGAKDAALRIKEMGTFLRQIGRDKSRVPQLNTVNPELLNLFMNLPFLETKK